MDIERLKPMILEYKFVQCVDISLGKSFEGLWRS